MLMIDDAHGVGILGNRGGGTPDLKNCAGQIDILMGCMDKAFGGTGGYLCGSKELIKYLRVVARSSLLSSAIPSVTAGAMIAVTRLIVNGQTKRQSLFEKSAYLRRRLTELGFTCVGQDNLPAIPVHIGAEDKAVQFAELLWQQGIFCVPFRWPAVPLGQARLRVTVMANHTDDQLNQFATACETVGRQLRLI
jgi:7-keto-8-aminopelargonate synthetase-like enzyme